MKLHDELTPAEWGRIWEEQQKRQTELQRQQRKGGGSSPTVKASPSGSGGGSVLLCILFSVCGTLLLSAANVLHGETSLLVTFIGLGWLGYNFKKVVQFAIGLVLLACLGWVILWLLGLFF